MSHEFICIFILTFFAAYQAMEIRKLKSHAVSVNNVLIDLGLARVKK